jgi:hypothetical protein
MDKDNRKTQKIVLLVSLAIILWGLFDLVTGDFKDLFNMSVFDNAVPSSRHTSFIVFFLVAIVIAFYSAKNLLKRQ